MDRMLNRELVLIVELGFVEIKDEVELESAQQARSWQR
jgi:hypothetical protein